MTEKYAEAGCIAVQSVGQFCCIARHLSPLRFAFHSWCLLTIAIGLVPTAVLADGAREKIEAWIARHEESLQSLQSFDITIIVKAPSPPQDPNQLRTWMKQEQHELGPMWKIRWLKDGEHERIENKPLRPMHPEQKFFGFSEVVLDGKKRYWLQNYDRKNPIDLTPAEQHGVKGWIEFITPEFVVLDPAQICLLCPRIDANEPRQDLRGFASRFERVAIQVDDARRCSFVLQGDSLDIVPKNELVEVELDKEHGWMISRLSRSQRGGSVGALSGIAAQQREFVVDRFESVGDGFAFPSQVRQTTTLPSSSSKIEMGRFEIVVNSLNQPIDSELFVMNYPRYLLVADATVDPDVAEWTVMGSGNQPLRKVMDAHDIAIFDAELKGAAKRSARVKIVVGVTVAAVVLVGLVLWWRKHYV